MAGGEVGAGSQPAEPQVLARPWRLQAAENPSPGREGDASSCLGAPGFLDPCKTR